MVGRVRWHWEAQEAFEAAGAGAMLRGEVYDEVFAEPCIPSCGEISLQRISRIPTVPGS